MKNQDIGNFNRLGLISSVIALAVAIVFIEIGQKFWEESKFSKMLKIGFLKRSICGDLFISRH